MKASLERPSVVVIGAASGTGCTRAFDVAASSSEPLSLADMNVAGLKRILERLPGETRLKTLVECPAAMLL